MIDNDDGDDDDDDDDEDNDDDDDGDDDMMTMKYIFMEKFSTFHAYVCIGA